MKRGMGMYNLINIQKLSAKGSFKNGWKIVKEESFVNFPGVMSIKEFFEDFNDLFLEDILNLPIDYNARSNGYNYDVIVMDSNEKPLYGINSIEF